MRTILLVLSLLLVACKPAEEAGRVVIDCTRANQTELGALLLELTPLIGGQLPDWASIEQKAIAAGVTIGGCALAELVQRYLAPPPGRAAPAREDGWMAHSVLERYRAQHAGGATFKTRLGAL